MKRKTKACCDLASFADEFVNAYIERFYVEGRGLVGPIDNEARLLVTALREHRHHVVESVQRRRAKR